MVECLPNVCSSESEGGGKRKGEGREGRENRGSEHKLLLRNTFVGRLVKQGVQ